MATLPSRIRGATTLSSSAIEALLLQIDRLHNVAREKKFNRPVHQYTNLALQPWQLGKIDPPPHEPGQQPGKPHGSAACQRQGQLCAGGLVSDDAKRTKGIEMESPQRQTLQLGFYIPCEQFGLAKRELCGGRARLASLRITYRRTVTQRPCAGMSWNGERMVNNNCASLIFLYGKRFQQWVWRCARRPHQS